MKKLPLLLMLLALMACRKEDGVQNKDPNTSSSVLNLPEVPFNYDPALPNYLTQGPVADADNTPVVNPITNEGATLGRVLFYEKNLSLNRSISCGNCHQQAKGFSDPLTLSDGFDGGKTGRHSMSLANSRYYANGRFFWDERAASLEDQVLMPIQDQVEMGMTLDSVIARLEKLPYYQDLFTDAFGNAEITEARIASSLAQFVRSMTSYNSKYDEGRAQVNNSDQPFPNFTAQENQGKALFLNPQIGCAACHGTDAFIAPGPRNNGLDAIITDQGAGINGNAQLNGKFKVGSLKNIGITDPYMHDGRFTTLREVIEHYNSGVQNSTALNPPLLLPDGQVRQLNLDETEKEALVAFLNTLTDEVMVKDEKFSDPFKE
ncbi:MAG TPA: cytochrome-c peroxidase [Cryomorphaceae bacterium]|nr:cytochrome-c peroxidase [Owenweeksia sp.]MBF99510.1 cytochrome-c peroxidase [Owenweeksia sp.]HAD96531.1 cytochrome-c peroxidase [Cryomorphaceae bacterium]HBF18520.1 cytochrome-c peroxidase [Cryomorphaceae bacterium]HCQ14721.1 cytochrome-c peroxidase [Cryomorphaceae bacterium]|tara:strand:- start:4064 stop:5191 length:1128 start_codon:yes stop_codon:yes gene_type:complete